MQTILATDLDGTLIHSKSAFTDLLKVSIVECYQDRPISFVTTNSVKLLQELANNIIPVTTRGFDQYQRINLGANFPFAIIENGAMILDKNLQKDKRWDHQIKLRKLDFKQDYALLKQFCGDFLEIANRDKKHPFDNRAKFVGNTKAFVEFKIHPENIYRQKLINEMQKFSRWNLHAHGKNKVYLVPDWLKKGYALQYLIDSYLQDRNIITAGNTPMDDDFVRLGQIQFTPNINEDTAPKWQKNLYRFGKENSTQYLLKTLKGNYHGTC